MGNYGDFCNSWNITYPEVFYKEQQLNSLLIHKNDSKRDRDRNRDTDEDTERG